MKYGKYEHLYQKTKNEEGIVKRIEKIEAQNWKVGYFILMGSYLLGMIIMFASFKVDTLKLFAGWEANFAGVFLLIGSIIAGFFGSSDYPKSTLMTAITIGIINYIAVIIYEVYPGIATEPLIINHLVVFLMAGIPALCLAFWIYPLFFCFIGSKIWERITNRVPRYV
ncbi:MAG: hypothetical protein KAR35_11350 [Candidatus Heimdallarchaeota archaeon]|nr:hypothetical protein [Candidatus Heimdallarchaeota archaeon]MCK5049956.1 hypothetical protein [Candidatus Heimdallarchaeota archaeon]